jgi:acetylglutamate kinase
LRHINNVSITVEDAPDDETLAELGLDTPWDLTGLYRGPPLLAFAQIGLNRRPEAALLEPC